MKMRGIGLTGEETELLAAMAVVAMLVALIAAVLT
jgi:hypothetical protein